MTSLGTLKTNLARDLMDPDGLTFSDAVLGDLISAGLADIGRIAPFPYQEDITVTADTLTYQLASDYFVSPERDVEVVRVEVWDETTTPMTFVTRLTPLATGYANQSDAGWTVWNGTLYLTNSMEAALVVGQHILRLWGYIPYPPVSADDDEIDLPSALEQALREYGQMKGYARLSNSRALFTQWQTASNNSDISFASLLNLKAEASQQWERRRRQLYEMRMGPW
jgi:hypothetical protein